MNEVRLVEELKKRYPDCDIQIRAMKKQGIGEVRGLTIKKPDSNIAPTIYPDYFDKFDFDVAVDKIAQLYEEFKVNGNVDMSWFTDFEKVKDKIQMRLVNREKNKDYLQDLATMIFMDLSIVFHVVVPELDGAITIRKQHLEHWNVDIYELYKTAMANTKIDELDIADYIIRMAGGNVPILPKGLMTIITNKDKNYGAGVLHLYLERNKGKKFYIIPSSVHECIIVPELQIGMNINDLKEMVKFVNANEVEPQDRLSDNAYYFDCEKLVV